MTSDKPRNLRKREGSYHHGDLRRALLDSALQLARSRGPAGFTLAEICRTAGVSQAAPYRHFESKEHILAVAAQEGFELLSKAIAEAVSDSATDFGEVLQRLARGYLCFARAHPAHLAVMFTNFSDNLFAGELKDPCSSGPLEPDQLPKPANRSESAMLATWQAGRGSFMDFAQALVEGSRASPLAAKVAEQDGRPFAAACWAMMHGVAVLWLEQMIPQDWEDNDFEKVATWIVAPWLEGMQTLYARASSPT
jgi:AcrR family transcriptional regulator